MCIKWTRKTILKIAKKMLSVQRSPVFTLISQVSMMSCFLLHTHPASILRLGFTSNGVKVGARRNRNRNRKNQTPLVMIQWKVVGVESRSGRTNQTQGPDSSTSLGYSSASRLPVRPSSFHLIINDVVIRRVYYKPPNCVPSKSQTAFVLF